MAPLVRVRDTCRLCGSAHIVRSVPLASVPIVSPNVGTETDETGQKIDTIVAPLDNYLCRDCGLIQLVHVVDPSLIYSNYRYRTSVSLGLSDHFRTLAEAARRRIGLDEGDHVVEFGSNDGTLLAFFKEAGARVTGVDPARDIAHEATKKGIPTIPDFFMESLANDIRARSGPARAILANNAMANIDDLGEIFRGVKALLAEDGMFVFETQYALDVFEKTLLDVIYHEHISCFSVAPIAQALGRFGLRVIDAERIAPKGGSIRFWIGHENGPHPVCPGVGELIALEEKIGLHDVAYHQRFAERVRELKRQLHELIDAERERGGTTAAYGTSVGCAALIHQLELEDSIEMLFDDSPFKPRLVGPGYDLPVYRGAELSEREPTLTVILAWRYAEPIAAKHAAYLDRGGRFVIPLPDVKLSE